LEAEMAKDSNKKQKVINHQKKPIKIVLDGYCG